VYCGVDAQRVKAKEEEECGIEFFGRVAKGDCFTLCSMMEY